MLYSWCWRNVYSEFIRSKGIMKQLLKYILTVKTYLKKNDKPKRP